MKALLALVLLFLAGCAGAPATPAVTVYEVETAYSTALNVAVAYRNLPPCTTAPTVICSRPDVVVKLQQADDVAYQALTAAQNTVRTPGAGANAQTAIVAAQQAVQALAAITASLQVKP